MADILVTGKGTFDCKDVLKEKFKAKFQSSPEKGWLVDAFHFDELVELGKQFDLFLDGKPAKDLKSAAPPPAGAPRQVPPQAPRQTPPPRQAQEREGAPPPKQESSLVSYAALEITGPDAKPVRIDSAYGQLSARVGFVRFDSTNTVKIGGKVAPLNQPFKEMARLAGVRLVTPTHIEVFDEETRKVIKVPNPYVTKLKGMVIAVEAKVAAIGFTETGHLHICERTAYFHLMTHLLHTLGKIVETTPAAGDFMTKAAFVDRGEDKHAWAFYPQIESIDEFTTTGIAVDLTYGKVREALANHLQLLKFADAGLQTKVETRAIKNFPGLGTPDMTDAMQAGDGIAYRRVIQIQGGGDKLEEVVDRYKHGMSLRDYKVTVDKGKREDISDIEFDEVLEDIPDEDIQAEHNENRDDDYMEGDEHEN